MKPRPQGFLSKDAIPHDSEQFDYIRELHDYLWRVVRIVKPGASGDLADLLDGAIAQLESRRNLRDEFAAQALPSAFQSCIGIGNENAECYEAARRAYSLADAMLAERATKGGTS